MSSHDDQVRERDQLQYKIGETTDQSLDSTRRIRQMCEETNEVGVKTLAELDEQGDRLNVIEEDLDQINQDMKTAEKSLGKMEKLFGVFRMPWKKNNKIKDEKVWTEKDSKDGNSKGGSSKRDGDFRADKAASNQGPIINRITNDAREDEMEENLEAVDSILGNLKNMAIDMGTALGTQNYQLDRINGKADAVGMRIDKTNDRTRKLLN